VVSCDKKIIRRGTAGLKKNFSMHLQFFYKHELQCSASVEMDRNGHDFVESRWEMLLKAFGLPLGTPKMIWKAAGKCPRLLDSTGQCLKDIE
jgi:hypothetical protein